MSTLLVLTVGRTDVQLVVDGTRRELSKRRYAELHDEIEQHIGGWRLVDSPTKRGKDEDNLPSGELLLCTPKLDAVLRYLDKKRIAPTAALVLETRRDTKSERGDPRYAGAVLEERLRAKRVETVHRKPFLEGTERLEDHGERRDIIRREVVRRIEQAVCETIETLKPSRIIVAAIGGFPDVSNLVEAIVRLHASAPVDALKVADGTQENPPTDDYAIPRTSTTEPLISFQARRRALDLIAKGNLLGAWAIAEPLHGDETERAWTQVIEWLACFASSLPMPGNCDIPILTHKRTAVRAALRVELGLRAGDIPRAVHGTVAFFEAALWDHLGEKVSRHPSKRLFKIDPAPNSDLVRKGDCSDEDRRRPFLRKEKTDGGDWYQIFDDDVCAIRLAKHYLKCSKLANLGQALSGDIRELRNDVAHGEPTLELMNDARHRMQEAKLWSETDTFLDQQLVQEVLEELGEKQPDRIREGLTETVRDRLLGGGHK